MNSMDYAHEPGIVYLKMNQQFLENVMDKDKKIAKDVAVGIISPKERPVSSRIRKISISEKDNEEDYGTDQNEKSGVIVQGKR